MVEINATKSTLLAKKIAINYSNESDFAVINNIIQIFRLLKINATFEKIDIHSDNYLKNIKTGITEENLTFLKKNDIFIHTSFDMRHFSKDNGDIDLNYYLNYALHCCFSLNFCEKNLIFQKTTSFFDNHRQFIVNQKDITDSLSKVKLLLLCQKLNKHSLDVIDDEKNVDVWYKIYFGEKHIIFDLKQTDALAIIDFIKTLLVYYGLEQYIVYFEEQQSINTIIMNLKEINKAGMIVTTKQMVECCSMKKNEYFFMLNYENNISKSRNDLPNRIDVCKFSLNGVFLVKELVECIKTKQIKIPDNTRLYQIITDDVEVYPNINFWNDVVINPTLIFETCEN